MLNPHCACWPEFARIVEHRHLQYAVVSADRGDLIFARHDEMPDAPFSPLLKRRQEYFIALGRFFAGGNEVVHSAVEVNQIEFGWLDKTINHQRFLSLR